MKVLRPERCVALDGSPCAACTEDIELKKEMNELEIRIEKIHIRRRVLRTTMNENHDLFIHKFPPEIASHIFTQYSSPRVSINKIYKIRLLYLGAVCQKWRQLAWATPELWTSLCISFGGKYDDDQPQLVTEWLERSASLLLTVRYVDRWGLIPGGDKIIVILNKHSARWHDMHFEVPAPRLHRFNGSSQENFLRRLVLHHHHPFTGAQGQPSDFSPFSMKSKSSPVDLTLTRVGLRCVDILWNNLTAASVNDIGLDDCLELIRRAPLLETLTLQTINSSDVFPIPDTRILHLHLHALELLEIWKEAVLTGILDSLCLPSLEQWIHNRSHFPLNNMISFGCLSPCLKKLEIDIEHVDYHQLTRFLSRLSSPECLCTSHDFSQSDHEKLIDLLCVSAQSPLFLPRLRSLEFLWDSFPCESLPQIFALSHWQSLRVKVDTPRGWHDAQVDVETVKLLLELVDRGYDLSIVRHSKFDLLQEYKENWLP